MSRQRREDNRDLFEVLGGGAVYLALLSVIAILIVLFGEHRAEMALFGIWFVGICLVGYRGWKEMER
jgi:hypothetical protein